jgi:hypothetical protein
MTSPHNAWLNRFLAWLMKVVGIKKTQVIYTSGESYAMDDDMNAEVTAELILNRHTLAFSSCFLFLPSRARSPTHSPTHPLTHSPTHPLTHSPTHPLTHSPTHPSPYFRSRSLPSSSRSSCLPKATSSCLCRTCCLVLRVDVVQLATSCNVACADVTLSALWKTLSSFLPLACKSVRFVSLVRLLMSIHVSLPCLHPTLAPH